jgi:hypothetical protein
MKSKLAVFVATAIVVVMMVGVASAQGGKETTTADQSTSSPDTNIGPKASTTTFKLVRSTAAEAHNNCLENAKGKVTITSAGGNQTMHVALSGMPKKTGFTLFIIQQPDSPFGLAWYQGDIDTDKDGKGSVSDRGILSDETHVFAQGSVAAPKVDAKDQTTNPTFGPVHTAHVGVWFADPAEANAAGCTSTVTPFDGDHEAGIQALSSKNFGPLAGPLLQVQ